MLVALYRKCQCARLYYTKAYNPHTISTLGPCPQDLTAPPGRHITGPSDRATWRVTTPDERIDLLPEAVRVFFPVAVRYALRAELNAYNLFFFTKEENVRRRCAHW